MFIDHRAERLERPFHPTLRQANLNPLLPSHT